MQPKKKDSQSGVSNSGETIYQTEGTSENTIKKNGQGISKKQKLIKDKDQIKQKNIAKGISVKINKVYEIKNNKETAEKV